MFDNYAKSALLKLLKSQTKAVSKLESKTEKLASVNTKLDQEVSYLKFQIEQFKRAMYGSKKERFIASENPDQFLEPTENIDGMKCIGQEITDELEYTPAKLFINRYIRNKYVAPVDEKGNQQVKIASLDFRPIPKCIAGTALLAQIITDKFVDHLPLYRQIQRFSREGVDIPSSTIDSWVRLVSQLLRPLYECHRQHTLNNGYLQADESPIKVQDTDKKGATHTGYMWVYHAPIPKSVYFDYRKGRGSE